MDKQKQKIIETYKQKSNVDPFDSGRNRYAFQIYKHKVESNFLKKACEKIDQKKIKVLDVACGTGRMLPEIFSIEKEVEYYGLDTSKEMTDILKKRAKLIKKDVKIYLKDALKMPFKDNTFDIVYSFHLLWHIPFKEQKKIVDEMLRVTKKGGIIVFDFLNKNFIWEKTKKILGKKTSKEIYKVNISRIKKLISKTKDIQIKKLSDAPIKNDSLYGLFNIINKFEKVLPSPFYHMIFVMARK